MAHNTLSRSAVPCGPIRLAFKRAVRTADPTDDARSVGSRSADRGNGFGKRHGTGQHRLDRSGHRRYGRGPDSDRECRRALLAVRGKAIRWKWAVVRDLDKERGVSLEGVRLTSQVGRLIEDEEVEIVVELMGGIEPALASRARQPEGRQARRHGEQGAAGRTRPARSSRRPARPIARWRLRRAWGGVSRSSRRLAVSLAANQIQNLAAILNGTCNYILT